MSVCKACDQPLVIELEHDEYEEQQAGGSSSAAANNAQPDTVPDDVELNCGCHFHWQCLLDESSTIATTAACPSCQSSSVIRDDSMPVVYTNEGGVQTLDILPTLKEEHYLAGNPQARPARAFLTFCQEGDVLSIVGLMNQLLAPESDDEMEEEEEEVARMHPAEILRYQDPLNGNKSAMHLAIEKGQIEVAWLLLWIASELPDHAFPANVRAMANMMGAARDMVGPGPDVRGLRDERGCDANALANVVGGPWTDFVNAGFFTI